MKALLVTSLLISGLSFGSENSIKLKKGIELIDNTTFGAESVAISDDGKKVCWIAKSKDSKIVIPSEVYFKDLGSDKAIKADKHGALNAFTKCSFDQDGELVTSKLHWRPLALTRTIVMGLIRGDFDPIGYVSSITTMDHTGNIINEIKPKHLELKSNRIFLKHPRYSPDGKWLTYYLKHGKKIEGVYLHHVKSGKTHQLSSVYDKHPTWSPDGKKILFHFQIDGDKVKPEQAFLGYFDLELSNDGEVKATRVLLDDVAATSFSYQKHPAMLSGTNLVFFHGEDEAGAKKSLFVRELKAKSKSFKLKLEMEDTKLTKAKHPASGAYDDRIVFIGKLKGQDEDNVFVLTKDALEKVLKEVRE